MLNCIHNSNIITLTVLFYRFCKVKIIKIPTRGTKMSYEKPANARRRRSSPDRPGRRRRSSEESGSSTRSPRSYKSGRKSYQDDHKKFPEDGRRTFTTEIEGIMPQPEISF